MPGFYGHLCLAKKDLIYNPLSSSGVLSQVWHRPHAPQFPPQEQEELPFFFFIISFAITATKSIAITAAMIIVIRVPFVIVLIICLMRSSRFYEKSQVICWNVDSCARPYR